MQTIQRVFLNSLVRCRASYGCHVWRPTRSNMPKLSSLQTKYEEVNQKTILERVIAVTGVGKTIFLKYFIEVFYKFQPK